MKTIKNKQLLVAADSAGVELKEAICEHLRKKGWEITDIGVKSVDEEKPEMFHRIGLKVGAKIAEGEFERAIIFCGTGMGIHIAASKCPHVHAAVCESVQSALRCITGNNCNVLSMGGLYITKTVGIMMANAYLENNFGDGYENWEKFNEFHQLAYDELEAFDYETFKANGFEFEELGEEDGWIGEEPKELSGHLVGRVGTL